MSPVTSSSTLFRWLQCFGLLMTLGLVLGCQPASEGESEQASHLEHEHELPAHWPKHLADAADQIEQRVEQLKSGQASSVGDSSQNQQTLQELRDIVGWLPEIAADSRLVESEWVPIYDACESLTAQLKQPGFSADPAQAKATEQLCQLLRTSHDLEQSRAPENSDQPSDEAEPEETALGDGTSAETGEAASSSITPARDYAEEATP